MRYSIFILLSFFLATMFFYSCKHSPLQIEDDFMPIDTTDNPIDTMTIDTMPQGIECDPDVVYFDMDILPILKSNCAFSDCHDADSAEGDVILESFESVIETAEVEAFDLEESKLYKVLVDDDEEDRMPLFPADPLTSNQIQLIAKWILQGAQDLECDPDFLGCDTENVSFSTFLKPIIENHCEGCHSGTVPSGGIDLTTYDNIKTIALNDGQLYGALNWDNGFTNMPQGGDKLSDCNIEKIQAWIDAGAPNN